MIISRLSFISLKVVKFVRVLSTSGFNNWTKGGFYSCTGKAKARDKAVVHWKTLETGSIVSLLHWKTVQMFIESREIGKRMTALENQDIFMKKTAN